MGSRVHRWVVDSIEEFVASVEIDGDRMAQMPLWLLPGTVTEGDVLAVRHEIGEAGDESTLHVVVDRAATQAAREASARQTKKGERQQNDPGGPVRF